MEEKQLNQKNQKAYRHISRQVTVQFLYMWEASNKNNWDNLLNDFYETYIENNLLLKKSYIFSKELLIGILENQDMIDNKIKLYIENWDFNRIIKTDLAILRLAVYELFYRKDIPPIVSINEAINLSKEFSDLKSKRFINGILDKIKNELNRSLRVSELN